MARKCDLTGTGVQTGNNVSHSKRRTRRRFLPNLQQVHLLSEALERRVALRVTAATLRSVDHNGGLDQFLTTTKAHRLTPLARKLRAQVKRAQSEKAAA